MTRQTRTFIVLAVALVAAIAASYGVYTAFAHRPVRQVAMPAGQAVVAKRAMPMGTLLTADDLKQVAWPTDAKVQGGFNSVDAVTGRGLVAGVAENELILEPKLAPRAAGAGLPPSITPGMRALSVKVNEVVGVAGFVVPGTRVDVLAVIRQKDENISQTVVKNVQVLTAGTRYDQEQAAKPDAKPIQSTVVTLLVTPEDAQRIVLAQADGRLQLALRNPLDVQTPESAAIGTAGLFGEMPKAVAMNAAPARKAVSKPKRVAAVVTPPPPAPEKKHYVVEMIRAAKRTEDVVR